MTKEEAKHMSEVLKAYSEGKIIQYKLKGEWADIGYLSITPNFIDKPTHYRVKPELQLRPYANAEEFLKAQKEHGPYMYYKNSCLFLPDRIEGNRIRWRNTAIGKDNEQSYKNLINHNYDYKWQDGTPCGIMEE